MNVKVLRTTSLILFFLMILINIYPAIVYASNEVKDIAISQENVEFNATINGNNNASIDIAEQGNLDMTVSVKKTGYLKKISIEFNGKNYEFSNTNVEELNDLLKEKAKVSQNQVNNKIIQLDNNLLENENTNRILVENTSETSQSNEEKQKELLQKDDYKEKINPLKRIEKEKIELNEIQAGEKANINIPIKFPKEEKITNDLFDNESKIILNAVYVNDNGEEQAIKKEINQYLNWNVQVEEFINQRLTRNVKYGNDKTLLGFQIQEGINKNVIPVLNKEIIVNVPKLNNKEPSKVIVLENNGISYKYENGRLTISKVNNQDNLDWNSQDIFNLVYLYDTQTEENEIASTAYSKITAVGNKLYEAQSEVSNFNISQQIGNLVDVENILPEKINKGYMFTNLNRSDNKLETQFNSLYNANVGYADLVDRIIVQEKNSEFLNQEFNEIKSADTNIINKRVGIVQENLVKILGDEGRIFVRDIEGNELAVLDKDNTTKEINNNSKLTIETTKPKDEGILSIGIEKAINGIVDYNKEQLKNFNILNTSLQVVSYNGEQELLNREIEKQILLENPTSYAKAGINKDSLSTVVENEDIVLNILLNTNDVSTALYQNPQILITLPNQVIDTNVKAVNKLYDNELQAKNMEVNGNQIKIDLNGVQTQYNNSSTEMGTLLSIAMNLKLDNLAPSSDEKIKVEYLNETTEDVNSLEIPIKIVAPSGMVLTNKIEVGDKSATSIQNEVSNIKIDANNEEKEMTISGTIINNLGNDTDNVNIIGRLPFAGNKSVLGQELNSSIDSILASPISVEGLDSATIYYSENGEETVDANSWSVEPTEKTRTFKIVKVDTLKDKQIARFSYKVKIPANVDYEKMAKENYAVYYNNGSIEGINKNVVEAVPVGIETGVAPEIKLEVTAEDTNEGYGIQDNGTVTEGEYITLKAKLTNTGSMDANNVVLKSTLPNGMGFVTYRQSTESYPIARYVQNYTTREAEKQIGVLKAGEEKTIEIPAKISQLISTMGNNNEASKLQTQFNVSADILPDGLQKSFTVNNTEGTLNLKLASSLESGTTSGDLFNYSIQVENANLKEKANVVIKVKLPKGIEFSEMNDKYETNYDKNTNELTIYYDTAKATPNLISFKAKVLDDIEDRLVTQATATFIGSNKEVKSNEVIFGTQKSSDIIQANQSTNISSNVFDTDQLEFYVEIKNNSNEMKSLQFIDMLPGEVSVKDYKLEIDGQVIEESNTKYIITPFDLPAGKTAKVKIQTSLYGQSVGEKYTIENKPIISMNGIGIKINPVSIDVNGTSSQLRIINSQEQKPGTSDNNQNKQESNITYVDGTNKIAGIAWIDENKNGKMDIEEKRLVNQVLTLFDALSNSIVKDEQNNPIQVTTNEKGEYSFANIKPGKYNVLSSYNTREYEPTAYKAQGLGEEENSNFTLAKFEQDDVLATDTVDLTNTSAYNINLGLVNREIFDLKLEQNLSKITIADVKSGIKEYFFKDNDTKGKVEINPNELEKATSLVEYTIKITNEGNQAGFAKEIVDYLPEGMKFSSDINPDWYLKNDGYVYNSTLMNTLIQPGETKELKLVAVKLLDSFNLGNTRNTAEIFNTYNEKGLNTIDAKAGNRADDEKDMSSTDVIIIRESGVKFIVVITISILIITLIVLGVIYIKRKWIDNMYQTEKIEGIDE